MLDPTEADTVEELAEIGVAFLELDLDAQRCSVVHGDEQQNHPAIQSLSGFSVSELALLDEIQWSWETRLGSPGVVQLSPSELRGRHGLLAGLHNRSGAYLGLLHIDRSQPFRPDQVEALERFSRIYARHLEGLTHREEPAPPAPILVAIPADPREWAWMDYC